MTVRLVLLALGLAALPVLAQTRAPSRAASGDAVAKYHQGARLYVDGELAPAEAAVRAGLALAPSDAKLKALLDLIVQDQENQDGDQNENEEGDSGDDGQDGDQNQDGGEDGDQGSEGDQQDSNGDGTPDEPGDAERDGTDQDPGDRGDNDGADGGGARPGEGGDTPDGQAGAAPGQMSRAQAERLLDAVGGEEQLLLREMRRAGSRVRRGDKDW